MTRFGEPIRNVPVSSGVDPQIKYSQSFSEWEAAHAANLNLFDWETGKYPPWFKNRVIAWHSTHLLVEMHKQDALAKDMERNRAKGKGKK